jgi:hypothetical protein
MDYIALIGTVIGIAGALAYVTYQRNKRLGEREFVKYIAFVAYGRLASGEHILLEDLKNIYARESTRLFGGAGPLTASESFEMVRFLEKSLKKSGLADPEMEWRMNSLKRSLRERGPIALGENYISNVGGVIILGCLFAVRSMLRGEFKGGLWGEIGVVVLEAVPALLFFFAFGYGMRMFLISRRALNQSMRGADAVK